MTEDKSNRGLFIAGLIANLAFLALALIDYSAWTSDFMWPIFIAWAVLIILLIILALFSAGSRLHILRDTSATPALARAVATLAARPATPSPMAVAVPASTVVRPVVVTEDPFPFTYNGYTLYSRKVDLKNGGARTIWFFSKRTPKSGQMAAKPAGFHVGVNERTGLPFLKKGTGHEGEDLTPAAPEHQLHPQCSALTADGKQCRNSARGESKYCASHFGYQPPTEKGLAKRIEGDSWSARDKLSNKQSVRGADTRPVVKRAPDTRVSVRKKPST